MKTVWFYFFTSFLAIILGLTLVNLIKPGVGADLSFAVTMETLPAADQSLGQLLIGAIPENIFKSLSEGNMLPVIFFSMVFGYFANLTSSAHQQVIPASLIQVLKL